MTREETICFLRQLQQILINSNSWKDVKQVIRESFSMAIKALEQPEPCGDTISRQMAIDAVSRGCQEFRGIFAECEKNLNELPSAQPERKKGKWIHERLCSSTGGTYPVTRCSVCENALPFEWEAQYCPNCGAKMEKE